MPPKRRWLEVLLGWAQRHSAESFHRWTGPAARSVNNSCRAVEGCHFGVGWKRPVSNAMGACAMTAVTTAWHPAELNPLSDESVAQLDGWFRAANYLSVGQIYLLENPLLRTPLSRDDVKPRLLGHWGTTPGLNFIYAHLNRVIKERGQSTIYVTGPGHGGPGLVANAYLDGTYSQVYSDITQDTEGLRRLFRQFSFPGGIPSHVAPETPGSIHEGGELGYALSHAYGAAFDHRDMLVAAVVGDGYAEIVALATSWHSNKFINPAKDGVVLPILHLNGYKIANPTVLDRIPASELRDLMSGYGHNAYTFEVKEG